MPLVGRRSLCSRVPEWEESLSLSVMTTQFQLHNPEKHRKPCLPMESPGYILLSPTLPFPVHPHHGALVCILRIPCLRQALWCARWITPSSNHIPTSQCIPHSHNISHIEIGLSDYLQGLPQPPVHTLLSSSNIHFIPCHSVDVPGASDSFPNSLTSHRL